MFPIFLIVVVLFLYFIVHTDMFHYEFKQQIQNQQTERKNWLQEKCNSGIGTRGLSTTHLFVDNKYKVLYCYIPKAGCTLWKNLLSAIHQNNPLPHNEMSIHTNKMLQKQGIKTLQTKTPITRDHILKTYQKFLFVRDPLERLVSAYRDKFEFNGDPNLYQHAKAMAKLYRDPNDVDVKSNPVTFSEFVKYVLSKHFNEHWSTFDSLCSPCAVNYTYIGKAHSFVEDSVHVLTDFFKLKEDNAKSLMKDMNINPRGRTNKTLVSRYLQQISAHSQQQLIDYYRDDYELFHYDPTLE